jgi:histidyl-tRNA synthetase
VEKIRAVKGMLDILPKDSFVWQHIERQLIRVAHQYAYKEIRFPLVELTALFKRAVGDVTDIVEKEMYTFLGRSSESLSLRPEGTAGCVRACIQNGLLRQPERLWYTGPMFRHEKPQKGRQRQFHQFGFEAIGLQSVEVDAELILMSAQLWKALGVSDAVKLEINTLGCKISRAEHRKSLIAFFQEHEALLDEDSKRRLHTNPLRILDSKNPNMSELIERAPKLMDYIKKEDLDQFKLLCGLLEACGVSYRINPNLVRGLDYYNLTVFEWVTDQLGAQGTVCAGGRYDGLVEQLGGKSTPAVGMAVGIERLGLLLEAMNVLPSPPPQCDIYVVLEKDEMLLKKVYGLVEYIRAELKDVNVLIHCGEASFKSQLKKADKSGAQIALIIGDSEFRNDEIAIKCLRDFNQREQFTCKSDDIVNTISSIIQK